jgi:hypothetical protein
VSARQAAAIAVEISEVRRDEEGAPQGVIPAPIAPRPSHS